jgi:hypothetical protein
MTNMCSMTVPTERPARPTLMLVPTGEGAVPASVSGARRASGEAAGRVRRRRVLVAAFVAATCTVLALPISATAGRVSTHASVQGWTDGQGASAATAGSGGSGTSSHGR